MTLVLSVAPGGKHRTVDIPVATLGRALLNFGLGMPEARVAVTGQSGIKASSIVEARRALEPSADHSADEHLVEDLIVEAGFIQPGVGFTIIGRPQWSGRLFGVFNVVWSWS